MGIAWHSSNCDSSELGCSSTSKQPTLQHTFIPWQGWRTPRLCPVSQEIWTHPGHHRPPNMACASSKAAARLPCHAMGKPCAIFKAAGSGASRVLGACSMSGMSRGAGSGTGVMLDPASLARPQDKHSWVHSPKHGLILGSTGSLLGTGTVQAGPSVAQPSTAGTASPPLLAL